MNPIIQHIIKEGEQFLHELLGTKHYSEISQAAECMSRFDNNQNCSELKKAIELLKKVNEEDRKAAGARLLKILLYATISYRRNVAKRKILLRQ